MELTIEESRRIHLNRFLVLGKAYMKKVMQCLLVGTIKTVGGFIKILLKTAQFKVPGS